MQSTYTIPLKNQYKKYCIFKGYHSFMQKKIQIKTKSTFDFIPLLLNLFSSPSPPPPPTTCTHSQTQTQPTATPSSPHATTQKNVVCSNMARVVVYDQIREDEIDSCSFFVRRITTCSLFSTS